MRNCVIFVKFGVKEWWLQEKSDLLDRSVFKQKKAQFGSERRRERSSFGNKTCVVHVGSFQGRGIIVVETSISL